MSLSIGGRLKAARENKGVSLDEAARFTKVQRKILESMEEDRIEEILDPAYRKIFLKKYAGYLGLDGQSVVSEYLSTQGPGGEEPAVLLNQRLRKEEPGPSIPRVLFPALIGLLSVVGMAFIGYLALDLSHPRQSARVSSPRTKPPQPAHQTTQPLVPLSKPLKLTIRTRADVWMQVKADGTVIFQNVLARGASESWTAKRELEIWTGNAGAMEFNLNGKLLENTARGVKKGIKVTHAGLRVPES